MFKAIEHPQPPSREYQRRIIAQKSKGPLNYSNSTHNRLLELRIKLQSFLASPRKEKIKTLNHLPKLVSKNSAWNIVPVLDRIFKHSYSREEITKLLYADAVHHYLEMFLEEEMTKYSYKHNVESNETFGDGYNEPLTEMMNNFTQDLANNGLNASRATIEHITLERAKKQLAEFAQHGINKSILITSPPDSKDSGYHGTDSKFNHKAPETHQTFFYLLSVGKVERDKDKNVINFEINNTQFRDYPNTATALKLHKELGDPITVNAGDSVPNLLFANSIVLDEEKLTKIVQKLGFSLNKSDDLGPQLKEKYDDQTQLEFLLKQVLYKDSRAYVKNFTQTPEINQDKFLRFQKELFNMFYLKNAQPVIDEILDIKTKKMDYKTVKKIQQKIDFLDEAFTSYSLVLKGWVKKNNTNENYQKDGSGKDTLMNKLSNFQQKIIFKILGLEQNTEIPSIDKLSRSLYALHNLKQGKTLSVSEKKDLLSTWSFFSFAGRFTSLLQCGAVAPFTMPISILKSSLGVPKFSLAISTMSIPQKREFLMAIEHEKYVELDLTNAKPYPAKKIYSVPESYLTGKGCIVDKDGNVLGPCEETVTINGIEVKKRISLEDSRDTLAVPMKLAEFNKYILELKQNLQNTTIDQIDKIFEEGGFTAKQLKQIKLAIEMIREKLIKPSLGLQDFISGNLVNDRIDTANKWLQDLALQLSFSSNPVATLIEFVEKSSQDDDEFFNKNVPELSL